MRHVKRTALHGTAILLPAFLAPAAPAQPTPVEELVMYTIEDENRRLCRYAFASNSFSEIGIVRDEATGTTLEDTEAMAFIPAGPHEGFYTSCNSTAPGWMKRRLIKLNVINASGKIYDYPGGPTTMIGYIRGSTAFKDGAGDWMLYGAQSAGGGTESRLVVINPADGLLAGSPLEIRDNAAPTQWVVCEGLAMNSTGALFGVEHAGDGAGKRSQLWSIDRGTGRATRIGGRIPFKRVESLEYVFGDHAPAISGLPAPADSWDASKGVMLGYSDNDDAFLIYNAASGSVVNFTTIRGSPMAFTALDVECMVVITQLQDRGGDITGGFD
jgi:hypothetical protein